jgi:AcrR family transcriptional regulator
MGDTRGQPAPEPSQEDDPSQWGTPEGRAMLDLLWDPPAPATRGPKQRLTLDRVVEAAMDLAAELGVEALSMRALATRLAVGTMSLYTYVPGREELFELMVDRAWSTRTRADPALSWRRQVEHHAREAWGMYQRFPWLVASNLWRMPLGPHILDIQEDLYRAVRTTGVAAYDVARVAGLVESHVFGLARSRVTDTSLAARTGVTTDDYWDSRSSFWGTYYRAERFPTMTWIWESRGFDQPAGDDPEFSLGLLLDGVELLVGRVAGRSGPA